MKQTVFTVLSLTAGAVHGLSSVGLDLGLNEPLLENYTLTWHDEFTKVAGQDLPSSSNWLFDVGTSYPGGPANWGSNEMQIYTKDPQNIRVTPEGTLVIVPRNPSEGVWTSARIETQRTNFHAARGGKLFIEAKIRTGCARSQFSKGIWPAFWALGSAFRGNYYNWPEVSEWDFLEVINGVPTAYNVLHCGTAPGGPCNEFTGLSNGGVHWSNCNWHWVGFEVDRTFIDGAIERWRLETLTWFIDGVQVHQVTGADVGDFATWNNVAWKNHFLLLNVAVGGDFPGAPNATTADGAKVRMEVDYVRVWNM